MIKKLSIVLLAVLILGGCSAPKEGSVNLNSDMFNVEYGPKVEVEGGGIVNVIKLTDKNSQCEFVVVGRYNTVTMEKIGYPNDKEVEK